MEKQNHKNIFESLIILNELNKGSDITIDNLSVDADEIPATFKKKDIKGFSLKLNPPRHFYYNETKINRLTFRTKKYTLQTEQPYTNNVSLYTILENISNFYTEGFNKDDMYYFRLIIPLKEKISFLYYIEQIHYQTNEYIHRECTKISYENIDLDLYLYEDRDQNKNYLIIDTFNKISFKDFSKHSFSALVSFGYITGNFPQNEGYFFAYNSSELNNPEHIYYTELRDSISSMYTPINRNSLRYSHAMELGLAEELYPTLRVLSLKEFSALCQWAYNSNEFISLLLLIIESSTSSLLLRPSGFSVALEGLTKILSPKNKNKSIIKPKDENQTEDLWEDIRKDLSAVLEKKDYSIKLKDESKVNYKDAIDILISRIGNMNRPKKNTNIDKLTVPFKNLNFILTEEDITAIAHRNDFLHGKITLDCDDDLRIYDVSLRLYTLLAVLVLKSIGYDNKILNYPKIINSNLNELHFRQV